MVLETKKARFFRKRHLFQWKMGFIEGCKNDGIFRKKALILLGRLKVVAISVALRKKALIST